MSEEWKEHLDHAYSEHFSDMAAERSTLKEYALDICPHLVELAKEGDPEQAHRGRLRRGTITYGAIAEEVGTPAQYVGKVLGIIDLVGDRMGDKQLSPLVERSGLMGPGRGYFLWDFASYDCEVDIDDESALSEEMEDRWRSDLYQTYKYEEWTE